MVIILEENVEFQMYIWQEIEKIGKI
jgi:hypothetical protein